MAFRYLVLGVEGPCAESNANEKSSARIKFDVWNGPNSHWLLDLVIKNKNKKQQQQKQTVKQTKRD